ncbi:MAG: hypothetical protein GY861_06190 [bacterium]|nr:hypothetical protein [bacterium]
MVKKTNGKAKRHSKKQQDLKVANINFVETPDASTRLAKVFDLLLGNAHVTDRSSYEKR